MDRSPNIAMIFTLTSLTGFSPLLSYVRVTASLSVTSQPEGVQHLEEDVKARRGILASNQFSPHSILIFFFLGCLRN